MQAIAVVKGNSADRLDGRVEAVEEVPVEGGPARLALAVSVFELAAQGGAELDGGGELGAALAARLERAVELDRPGAVSRPSMRWCSLRRRAMAGALGIRWQHWRGAIEGLDPCAKPSPPRPSTGA